MSQQLGNATRARGGPDRPELLGLLHPDDGDDAGRGDVLDDLQTGHVEAFL